MMVRDRQDYEATIEALALCISARVPVLLWGNPGEGKTSVVESARLLGWHVETLIVSHYEPSDFAGLPVVGADGSVTLAPPAWASRLAAVDGPSIAFFDEFSTASPSLQASALRPLTHSEVGSLQLPDSVAFVAAANPADVAAAGWELAAPTTSRFVHLDWALPLDVYAESTVTRSWPELPLVDLDPAEIEEALAIQRVLVSGFLRSRSTQLSVIPEDPVARGRAFPTPRTWEYAARLLAAADVQGSGPAVRRFLVAGCLGAAVAHEFLAWVATGDLPDPEELLASADPGAFLGLRPDRAYVTLQAVLGAVIRQPTPERWTTALILCSYAAEAVGLDPAVPVVRALVRPGIRPEGAAVPPEIKVFAPALTLAGLM